MRRGVAVVLAGCLLIRCGTEILAVHSQHAGARGGFGKRVCRSWKRGWVLVVPLSPTLSCIPSSMLKHVSTLEAAGFGMLLKKIKALYQKASGLCGLSLISSS